VPALIGSISLLISQIFWHHAVITEKYILCALFSSILLVLILKFLFFSLNNDEKINLLFLFFFIFGLSLNHHIQMIYFVPCGFILLILAHKILNIKSLLKIILLFFLPFFLKFYIPIRAKEVEFSSYWGDFSNINGILQYLQSQIYQKNIITSFFKVLTRIKFHIWFFINQFKFILFILGSVGIFVSFKKYRLFTLICLFTISLN
jgi:hypothetical protein